MSAAWITTASDKHAVVISNAQQEDLQQSKHVTLLGEFVCCAPAAAHEQTPKKQYTQHCVMVKYAGMQASPAQAAPGQSGGNPAILLGLVALVAGGVLAAKQTQPQSDSKSSGDGGGGPSASTRGQAPQSAGMCMHICIRVKVLQQQANPLGKSCTAATTSARGHSSCGHVKCARNHQLLLSASGPDVLLGHCSGKLLCCLKTFPCPSALVRQIVWLQYRLASRHQIP